MSSYPHMCRVGHVEIGHSESDLEMCPICILLGTLSNLRQSCLGLAERLEDDGQLPLATRVREWAALADSCASEVQR